jgi:hypothetical protein
MLPIAADWSTVSSLATGFGTLVLAVATFASVRSSNRSARIAEVALQEQRRPVLVPSRPEDPIQKIMFVEGHWVKAAGGRGVAEHDGSIYLALSVRNVGSGLGVCQGWSVTAGQQTLRSSPHHTPEEQFRLQSRDLYIAGGDIGMWQGALRDRRDPTYQDIAEAIDRRDSISIELLYSDQVGDQRTISRFALTPFDERLENGETRVGWFASVNRHWFLDRPGPRSDEQVAAAAEVILRAREAGEEAAREEAAAAEQAAALSNGARADAEDPDATGTDATETDERGPVPVEINRG